MAEAEKNSGIRLRRMIRDDLPEVLGIERRAFSNPWPLSTFEGEIQNTGLSFPLVAVDEGTGGIVGYCIYWVIHDEVQVNNIAVHPDYRRRRIAEDMLRGIFAELRKRNIRAVLLEVRAGNGPARLLYEKLGFNAIGRRKDYYTHPTEDAVVMELVLGPDRL
ncbi:MAG: ribosomal protein S18-alanine N-acetyltransferase [Candidatus Aminicenantes bacterium]|nr:ribosomal protein S18-alanine N-acetyltransferase [Candidatus Aminicenantes bacterium]